MCDIDRGAVWYTLSVSLSGEDCISIGVGMVIMFLFYVTRSEDCISIGVGMVIMFLFLCYPVRRLYLHWSGYGYNVSFFYVTRSEDCISIGVGMVIMFLFYVTRSEDCIFIGLGMVIMFIFYVTRSEDCISIGVGMVIMFIFYVTRSQKQWNVSCKRHITWHRAFLWNYLNLFDRKQYLRFWYLVCLIISNTEEYVSIVNDTDVHQVTAYFPLPSNPCYYICHSHLAHWTPSQYKDRYEDSRVKDKTVVRPSYL